jgi:hypothetical protein
MKLSLSLQSPRLTELPGERHPLVCQACGGSSFPGHGNGLLRASLDRWQEHDHQDKPEERLLVLCNHCSKLLIKPHPRLYSRLHPNQPWPGCMAICVDCMQRDGVRCTDPRAKANGGQGVALVIRKPITGMVDGVGYRGPVQIWPAPAEQCHQKKTAHP